MIAARSGITDMVATDDTYVVLDAAGSQISDVEFRAWAMRQSFDILNPNISEEDFDERCKELPGKRFGRLGASSASGSVLTVTRVDGSSSQIMPAGTTFGRNDGSDATYRTLVPLTFNVGTIALLGVYVECTKPGRAGNVPIGVISKMLRGPSWVLSAYNDSPLSNGDEKETLVHAQMRVEKYLSALGGSQKAAMEYLALTYLSSTNTRARTAKGFYDPLNRTAQLLVDDGSGFAGTTTTMAAMSGTVPKGGQTTIVHPGPATVPIPALKVVRYGGGMDYLTEAAGQMVSVYESGYIYVPSGNSWSLREGDVWSIAEFAVYNGFISELQTVICGDVNDPSNTPGWQAFGCRVSVAPPDPLLFSADIHVVPVTGANLDDVQNAVKSATVAFIQNMGPGEPMYMSQLVAFVSQIPEVLDVKFFQRNVSPAVPLADVYPSATQAIRTYGSALNFVQAT